MLALMFIQFLKTRICRIGLLMVMILGIISILVGKQFLVVQDKTTSYVVENYRDHLKRNLEYHGGDIGELLYYLQFTLVKPSNDLAALSIGQQDINSDVQTVTILNLEAQRYDTDLVNPVSLLHGNLDLSFVILFVFPLLIIAFTYNLRSEEVESGTWRLVSVTSRSNLVFLLQKLTVRAALVAMSLILLCVIASIVLAVPWNASFLAFMTAALLYLFFWHALCFWVVTLRRSSAANALSLLAGWLILVILLPSAINNHITNMYPVPEALTTMIKQRDGYHKKWDTGKKETVQKLYTSYPQLAQFGFPPETGFTWHWYYAMQHAGDQEALKESLAMQEKIQQREQMSRRYAKFVPTLHSQLVFNDLAGTSLIDHTDFLEQTRIFHERIRLHFYPKIFQNSDASEVDWNQFEPVFLEADSQVNWFGSMLPLIIGCLLFSGLALGNSRMV